MEIDYNLLREDVKFPLIWDCEEYKMFIFDSDHNMVAQVDYDNFSATENDHPFERVLGGIWTDIEVKSRLYFLDDGDFYDRQRGRRIGLVRGWGRLSKKKDSEKRQDNIANYILNILNSIE